MPLRLTSEVEPGIQNASDIDLERALEALASPQGPTFIMLTDTKGGSLRALGSNGRYAVEGREAVPGRLLRWRAGALDSSNDSEVTVGFFRKCPRGIHAPRQCPFVVRSGEVLGIDDVTLILSAYHDDQRMHLGYTWRITEGRSVARTNVLTPGMPRLVATSAERPDPTPHLIALLPAMG